MKKGNKKGRWHLLIGLISLLAASLFFGACSFSDSGGSSLPLPTPESEYNILSTNSFMGGSLMYSQRGGQLSPGRTFGVRFATLKKITMVGEGGQTIDVYEEANDSEKYGTIGIISISTDSIYFTCSIYSKDGKSKSTSIHYLKTGQSVDLNNDGQADITYKIPGVKRTEFSDARYLTFIVNEEGLQTTMFSHYDKEAAGLPITGFFGINTEGNFLMLAESQPSSVPQGFADGDFIIYPKPDEYGVEVYGVVAAVSNTTGKYSGTRLVKASDFTKDDIAWEDFETFYYIPEQFPDEDGPKELLRALPASVQPENLDSLNKEECVDALNDILVDPEKVTTVFNALGIVLSANEKAYFDAYTKAPYDAAKRTGAVANYLTVVRPYFDEYYDDSPDGETNLPDFANAYIYLALNMGTITPFDSAQNMQESSARLAKSSSYDDYISKNKFLTKKFGVYRAKDVDLGRLSDIGVNLKVGVRGDITITKKKTSGYLGVAALASYELDGESIPVISGKELGGKDLNLGATVMAGYVPLNVRLDGSFKITMDVDAVISNFYAGFTGFYEGQIDFGAFYKIFPPDVSFHLGRTANADTAWYAGKKQKDVDIKVDSATVTIHPTFNLTIGGGIGPEYAFANITLPLDLVGNIPYTWDRASNSLKTGDKTINTTIKIGADIGVVIPVVNKKISKPFTIITIFDKQLNLKDMTWKNPPY